MRAAEVYVRGQLAGQLIEEDSEEYVFRYDPQYVIAPNSRAVSLTLPKSTDEYRSEIMFPCFSNMIAEGSNLHLQSRLLRIDENDEMGLLLATAQYDTIGAVTFKPLLLP